MVAASAWTPLDVTGMGIDAAWATGGGTATFTDNVNVLVQEVSGVGLDDYVTLSEQALRELDPEMQVISFTVEQSAGGQPYGRMEYVADLGSGRLYFLATVVEVPTGFALATYSAAPEAAPAEVGTVEPYLVTLAPA